MKYCNHCGNQVLDEAVICPKCGCSPGGATQPIASPISTEEDKVNGGLMVASILIPLVGIILAILKWKETPNAAKSYLTAAIIAWVVGAILIGIIYGSAFASFY